MGRPQRRNVETNPFAGGAPELNPFGENQSPLATREKSRPASPERKEVSKKPKSESIEDLRRKAETVKSNPDAKAAEAITAIRSNESPAKQAEGLTGLNEALVSILTKLAKKGADIAAIKGDADLKKALTDYPIELTLAERAAIEHMDRITSGSGPTAVQVANSWPQRIDAAREASKGWGSRYLGYWKKDPFSTGVLSIAGVAGFIGAVFIGKTAIEKIFASASTDKSKGKGGPSWLKKEIFIPVGIAAACAVFGRETLIKIFADAGLDFLKVDEKLKKGEDLTNEEVEKVKKAGEKIQEKAEEEQNKRSGGQKDEVKTETWAPETATVPDSTNPVPSPTRAPDAYVSESAKTNNADTIAQLKESMEPAQKFRLAQSFFITMLFYEREYKEKEFDRNRIEKATYDLKEVNIARIENAVEEAKTTKAIPRTSFPEITENLNERETYDLLHKITIFSKILGPQREGMTVREVFLAVIDNPVTRGNEIFHTDIAKKLKERDFRGALSSLDFKGMNETIRAGIKQNGKAFREAINRSLDPTTQDRINRLSSENKIALEKIQIDLMLYENLAEPKNAAIDGAIRRLELKSVDPEVRSIAIDFFKDVQTQTRVLLPNVIKRYDIKEADDKEPGFLAKGLQYEGLTFQHATELIIASQSIDWNNKDPEEASWMKDLAMLHVVLRATNPDQRDAYLGTLYGELIYSDQILTIPGLKNLLPYLNGLKGIAEEAASLAGLQVLRQARAFMERSPDVGTTAHREFSVEQPWIAFPTEVAGGALEIPRATLALVISTLNWTETDLSGIRTAEEFIRLVMEDSRGNVVYNKDNPAIVGLQIGANLLFIRPAGILKESFHELILKQNPTGAISTWVVGTSPFICAGAGWEAWKSLGILKRGKDVERNLGALLRALSRGSWQGLQYPIKMPIWALEKGAGFAMSSIEYSRRPGHAAAGVYHWGADFIRYRSPFPGQSMSNLMRTGELLESYHGDTLTRRTSRIRDEITRLERALANGRYSFVKSQLKQIELFLTRVKGKTLTAVELMRLLKKEPNQLFNLLASGFRGKMSEKYAKKLAGQYNDFFEKEIIEITEETLSNRKIDSILQKFQNLKNFAESSNKSPEAFDDIIRAIKNSTDDKKLTVEINKILRERFPDFGEAERMTLAEQLRSEKAVKILQGKAKERAGFFENTPKPVSEPSVPRSDAPEVTRPAEPEKPVRIGQTNRYAYGGDEFIISKRQIELKQKELQNQRGGSGSGGRAKKVNVRVAREEAIEAICRQRWNTPEFIKNTADGKSFKFRGKEIVLTGDETLNNASRLAAAEAKYAAPETISTIANSEAALKSANKELVAVQKRIAEAERDITTVNRLRKGPQFKAQAAALQQRVDDARQIIADGQQAQAKIEKSIRLLRNVKEAESALDAAKAAKDMSRIATLTDEFTTASKAATEALEASGKATQNIGRLGRLGTAAKWGGRGLLGIGVGADVWMAGSSAIEAATTDVEGRGTIKGLEAGMWGVSAGANAAALAVMFGAKGAALTGASAAAAPLAPLTYAGSKVFETLYEETKKDYEWIQGNPYEVLHHFYTSFNSCSLGDAWTTVWSNSLIERSFKAKTETMHKIFRGLVAIQKDPQLINDMLSGKITPKDIESRIEKNYSKYHEFYFRNSVPTGIQSYASAQRFILEAQMFDEIMTQRDEARERGENFIIMGKDTSRPFSLHLDRYDITGEKTSPKARVNYNPSHVVEAYKESLMQFIERDECMADNLKRMSTAYLIRLYVQMHLKLEKGASDESAINADPGLRQFLTAQMMTLAGYLKAGRGINLAFASRQPEFFEPKMSLKNLTEQLEGFNDLENKAYLKFEKDNHSMTPALQALYRLGEYFGYVGEPTETGLKAFFSKETASFHGLYWNGSEWMLQERGMEFDDKLGPILSSAVIEKAIELMRENPDDILEHRQDAIFLDAYDYTHEVRKMADTLENGLKEGAERNYKRSDIEAKQEVVAPPRAFDPMNINYSQPKEALMTDYASAIEYTKVQTAWTQLRFEVKDETTISLSRNDGGATTELKRATENQWSIGQGLGTNLSLIQAVALGNLKNWAEQWVSKEKLRGGSERPFEIDGERIDFDKAGTPFDTTFLKHWIDFYDKIGINRQQAVDLLNNWYEKEVARR